MVDGLTRRDFMAQAAIAGAASALAFAHPAVAEPTPKSTRALQRKASFDEDWKFSRGDFPEARLPQFDDASWAAVELPHDWSIAGPYSESEPCGGPGGYVPTGFGWYRRSFFAKPGCDLKSAQAGSPTASAHP